MDLGSLGAESIGGRPRGKKPPLNIFQTPNPKIGTIVERVNKNLPKLWEWWNPNLWLELTSQVIHQPVSCESLSAFSTNGSINTGPRTCGDLLLVVAPFSPREILRNFPLPPQGGRREPVSLTQVAGRLDALEVGLEMSGMGQWVPPTTVQRWDWALTMMVMMMRIRMRVTISMMDLVASTALMFILRGQVGGGQTQQDGSLFGLWSVRRFGSHLRPWAGHDVGGAPLRNSRGFFLELGDIDVRLKYKIGWPWDYGLEATTFTSWIHLNPSESHDGRDMLFQWYHQAVEGAQANSSIVLFMDVIHYDINISLHASFTQN